MSGISENILQVRSLIDTAAQGKRGVTLVAVSKFQGPDKIQRAVDAGQRVFGENRVQEALLKWPRVKARYPDVQLHLIGPLQTNKVKDALGLFDVIETVDRQKLADALLKEMEKTGRRPDCYVQVNVGGEAQKSGVSVREADDFIQRAVKSGLPVKGVMCIPPVGENPKPYFIWLKELADSHGLAAVSMGMSGDFEQAVACGATHVRVGTAIFGEREKADS